MNFSICKHFFSLIVFSIEGLYHFGSRSQNQKHSNKDQQKPPSNPCKIPFYSDWNTSTEQPKGKFTVFQWTKMLDHLPWDHISAIIYFLMCLKRKIHWALLFMKEKKLEIYLFKGTWQNNFDINKKKSNTLQLLVCEFAVHATVWNMRYLLDDW